ncbi:MAG: PAS domain S-box protein [Chloroflexota bacterium]
MDGAANERLTGAQATPPRRSSLLRESNFWYTLAMIVVGALLHYSNPLANYMADLPIQLTRYHMNRILFIVPVVYAGFIFGPRGGFVALAAVTAIMLPRALFSSPSPADSSLEVVAIVVVSGLIILWFNGQEKEKQRRQEVVGRLELARQELATQVDIIKKNEHRLSAINDVCGVVTQSLGLKDTLDLMLDRVVSEMDVEIALIFLKDAVGKRIALVGHRGVSPAFAAAVATLNVGEGFNGRVTASGQPMMVENASQDARLSVAQVRAEAIQAQLIVPLRSKGATIGTLCVGVRGSRRFSPDDLELLAAIGSQMGIAIENARLYQDALASEEKYRDLFANATVSIFVHDLAGTITAANHACTGLTGYPPDELLGMQMADLFPTHARAVLAKVQADLLQGKERGDPYDIPLVRRDGAECILSMSTRLVREKEEPWGLQHIAMDVTERRRMRDTLNYYVRQVLTAQEEERKRIARELHDDTAQSMLLILQRLDALSYHAGKGLPDPAAREVENLHAVLLQTLGNLRRLTRDLRPQILDDLGLVAAVEWLADDTERQSGIQVTVQVEGAQRDLPPEVQLLLFRIVQEALSNVRRHSAADHAQVTLTFLTGRVRVVVADDGQGFVMPESLSDLTGAGKLGLLGMAERAKLLSGSLQIASQPGRGTTVTADLGEQFVAVAAT